MICFVFFSLKGFALLKKDFFINVKISHYWFYRRELLKKKQKKKIRMVTEKKLLNITKQIKMPKRESKY